MKSTKRLSIIVNGDIYHLNNDKLLLGKASNADIQIHNDAISHYHSMIFSTGDEFSILDLNSKNATFINGNKIDCLTPFSEGDTISFGSLHCEIISNTEQVNFINNEDTVEQLDIVNDSKIHIPIAENENQVLIDDEFCDILFDDVQNENYTQNPLNNISYSKEFIETDSLEESFDLLKPNEEECVQVSNFLNGTLLEQYYFPIEDGTIYATGKMKPGSVYVDFLDENETLPLYKLRDNAIQIENNEYFQSNHNSISLDQDKVIYLKSGAYQIFIEKSHAPSEYLHISSLQRDRNFYQDTAKKFAATMLPLLLLLLVDFSIEKVKPIKELSIIYKKPTNSEVNNKKMASSNPNSKNTNTGHKANKQPKKKISHSKAGKKSKPAPSKVAKSSAAKAPSKVKAKTKAYNFKMKANVSSLFSNTKVAKVAKNGKSSSVKTTSSTTASLNTKVTGVSNDVVGNMGSDNLGRNLASMGAKGLSSKMGRDTAYIQTETVVLGSMDPELLRKILQQYLPQFRHCYQQELAYNSDDIKGIVDLNFEINPSGKVGKIKIKAKDSRFSRKGTNCMADVLAIIDFPKPKGGGRVAVKQPLSFFAEAQRS